MPAHHHLHLGQRKVNGSLGAAPQTPELAGWQTVQGTASRYWGRRVEAELGGSRQDPGGSAQRGSVHPPGWLRAVWLCPTVSECSTFLTFSSSSTLENKGSVREWAKWQGFTPRPPA